MGREAGRLCIVGVQIGASGRTLKMATDPHPTDGAMSCRWSRPGRTGLKTGEWSWRLHTTSAGQMGMEPASAEPGEEPRGLVAVARPRNDEALDERLAAARRKRGSARKPGRMALSAVTLPQGTATVRLESTGLIEECILGETQGEPKAAKGLRTSPS